MLRSLILATLVGVAVLGSTSDANAFLFGGMGGCGCDSCCEPCCDSGRGCCLLGGLRGIFHRHNDCCCEETCCCEEASCGCEEPSCEAEEASCGCEGDDCGCEADCCCEPCCERPRCCLFGGLRGLFNRHRGCGCCEVSCGCEADCGCGN